MFSLSETALTTEDNDPSRQVQFDRSNTDTGLAVTLAENGTQIPPDFITDAGLVLRCMVDRCATRLLNEPSNDGHHDQWCTSCTRLVCDECLAFDAKDINDPSSTVQKICVDCLMQLVDVMESCGDIHLRQ